MTQDSIEKQGKDVNPLSEMPSKQARIMVVDDERDILDIIRKYLQKWDFEVDSFSDPSEALENFASRPDYQLLISDIRMPGMTGIELASKIIDLKPTIHVVLMTAFETDNIVLPVNPSGSTNIIRRQDILKKPFRLDQVCQAVKRQLIKE